MLSSSVCWIECNPSHFYRIVFEISWKTSTSTPMLSPRNAIIPLSSKLLVPSSHQCGGNMLRINIRSIKCNRTQCSCIIFQILFKMGYLTQFKQVYLTNLISDICIIQHKFPFNDVIGYKKILTFHIQLWKFCFLKL